MKYGFKTFILNCKSIVLVFIVTVIVKLRITSGSDKWALITTQNIIVTISVLFSRVLATQELVYVLFSPFQNLWRDYF